MKSFPIPSMPAPSGGESPPPKGEGARTASYAQGGAVLGRSRSFMKEPDPFSAGMAVGNTAEAPPVKAKPGSPQDYAGGKPKGKDKSAVKTPMPGK